MAIAKAYAFGSIKKCERKHGENPKQNSRTNTNSTYHHQDQH